MADSMVKVVLKAVDNYSGVLTGLNQGLELIGKGFDFLKSTASLAGSAIANSLDSIQAGGAFREQESQLKNLASAYNVSAKDIVKSIKDIGINSTNLSSTLTLSTKAIVTGLSGPEIENVLKFTKRFTEATGENFEAMSKRIFEALATGEFSTLKQLGIFVKSGSSAKEVVEQLSQKLDNFGSAAFNTTDIVTSLGTSIDDFKTFLGAAVNDVPVLQQALTFLSKSVYDFVYSFDTSPITNFLEFIGRILKALYEAFSNTFGDIGKRIYEVLRSIQTSNGFQIFAKVIIESLKSTVSFIGTWATVFAERASEVIGLAGIVAEGWGNLYRFLKVNGLEAAIFISKAFGRAVSDSAQQLNSLIQAFPSLANALGLDAASEDLANFQKNINAGIKSLIEWKKDAEIETNIGDVIGEIGEKARTLSDSFGGDNLNKINQFADEAVQKLSEIKIPDLKIEAETSTSQLQAEALKNLSDSSRELTEANNQEKESKKKVLQLSELQRQEQLQQEKISRDSESQQRVALTDLRQRLSDIADLKERAAKVNLLTGNIDDVLFARKYQPGSIGLRQLENEEKQIREVLKKVEESEKKSRELRVQGTLENLSKLGPNALREIEKSGGILSQALNRSKLNVDVNVKSQLEQDIQSTIQNTNWPQELRALGEFLLRFIITKARGERIPLVVATV